MVPGIPSFSTTSLRTPRSPRQRPLRPPNGREGLERSQATSACAPLRGWHLGLWPSVFRLRVVADPAAPVDPSFAAPESTAMCSAGAERKRARARDVSAPRSLRSARGREPASPGARAAAQDGRERATRGRRTAVGSAAERAMAPRRFSTQSRANRDVSANLVHFRARLRSAGRGRAWSNFAQQAKSSLGSTRRKAAAIEDSCSCVRCAGRSLPPTTALTRPRLENSVSITQLLGSIGDSRREHDAHGSAT